MDENEKIKKSPKTSNKKKKRQKSRARPVSTDDDNDDSDYIPILDDDDITKDNKAYLEFLNELFPSNYMKEKVNKEKNNKNNKKNNKKRAFNKLKKNANNKNNNSNKNNNNSNKNKKANKNGKANKNANNKRKNNKNKKGKKENVKMDVEEFPSDEDELLDEQEEMMVNPTKFNIIYTIGGRGKTFNSEHDEDEYECDTETAESDSDSNNSDSSIDPKDFENVDVDDITEEEWEKLMRKQEEQLMEEERERKEMLESLKVGDKVKVKKRTWEKKYIGTIKKIYNKNGEKQLYDIKLDNDEFELLKKMREYVIIEKFEKSKNTVPKSIQKLLRLKDKHPEKYEEELKKYEKEMKVYEDKILEKKEKKVKQKNVDRFKKMMKEKNNTNDLSYFKNMKIEEQKNILRNLFEINKMTTVKKPYKLSLIEAPIPPTVKAVAMKKVNMLSMMDPCSGDYYKNKLWVDTFMSIPFGKYNSLPVDFKNGEGIQECRKFMEDSKKVLDDCVYGLNDAKMQIMQMIGGWISNPNAVGTAIAIQGPMGTGKTTLVKEGISKILNRPFAFIPLGGATDSSYLEGHSYTYEGSIWGKIVDVLIHSKCMNPVFYFDELDKVSNTPKGEEIIGILTHLTDTTQNSQFHDKYFSNLDFDLSKALFIFSYNHEEKVNAILKDRMYRIKTKGYEKKDKKIISGKYLIPKIEKNINFKDGEIIIPDETIEYICDKYTDGEKGVRNLKRCLEIIYGKLNLFRLMEKDSKLFDGEEVIQIEYPFTVTTKVVDKLIKQQDKATIPFGMYM